MQPLINDATTAILRALRVNFVNFEGFVLEEVRSRGWASATFAGARHQLVFRLEGEGADAAADGFLARLGGAPFMLRGHVLADLVLVSEQREPGRVRIGLEALTVEDG
jgi:hypothetical protein